MSDTTSLVEQARAWQRDDCDPAMRAALDVAIDRVEAGDTAAAEDLCDAFDGTLQFGTAGLRGAVGPGPNRMNEVVVVRAAAGLADFLLQSGGGSVVIGHDARHGSEQFARASAEILSGAGLTVLMLPPLAPTPVLAYAIRELGCAAGVMVTASHNPQRDNGYKVYLGDGMQIVSPADAQISEAIAQVTERGPVATLPRSDAWTRLGDETLQSYVRKTAALVDMSESGPVRVAYTPLHGVGGPTFLQVLTNAGISAPTVVRSQFDPDPNFGGMPFPNPEEPGVMDAVLALAEQEGCDVAVANDPDADRCAIGVPSPDGWRMLTGDEVGWLLGWWIASGNRRQGGRNVLAQSIVSGSMLEAIAADAGLPYAQTLTGFKWIARVPDLAFGYEEALGYCVDPAAVRDKDGISAGLMFIEMVGSLALRGATVLDVLDDLAVRHGVYATGQVAVRHADPTVIRDIMSALRLSPPSSLGGLDVTAIDDLERPEDGLPPTDGLRIALRGGNRVIIRPSGTEAKVKAYLQSRVEVKGDLDAARSQAETQLSTMRDSVAQLLTAPEKSTESP
ncbi:MAG: phospho-sugar mutase [Candidatus Nanopelagicales bacterium]